MEEDEDVQSPFFYYCRNFNAVPSHLFADQSDHMPSPLSLSDLHLALRAAAISLFSKVKLSYNLDPLLVYLSINYIDRFLSKQQILEKKTWIAHILVLASLSLAAKMMNYDPSILLSDLQRNQGFEFDSPSVHRMETILLATLQWRMRSITPFSFLQHFISLCKIEDSSQFTITNRRASDIIFNIQHEIKVLQYEPSTVAASALLLATEDLNPAALSSSRESISSCEYVDEETLVECLSVMQEYKSTANVHRASAERNNSADDVQRQRLNGVTTIEQFQISQVQHC